VPSLYVDGQWVSAAAGGEREIHCPYDQALIAIVDEAGPADVDAAIRAARTAFDSGAWPGTAATQRGALLLRVADLLERGSAAVDKAKADLAAGRISAAEYERIMGNGDCSVGSTSPTADESLRPAVLNRSDPGSFSFRNN